MSIILDALKQMDERRTGSLKDNNVHAFYKKQSHLFIDHYKYWIITGVFIFFIVLTSTLFFLHHKVASLPVAPIAVSKVEAKKETSFSPEDKPISVLEPMRWSASSTPHAEQMVVAKPRIAPDHESKPVTGPIPDPDVNQQASEQIQAVIQHDPSVPPSAVIDEEATAGKDDLVVDNSIQFAESGPSEEALKELKDNLAASMNRQSYAQIIEDANAALSTYPKDVDLHYYLGLAYFNLNRYADALNILTQLQPSMAHYSDYYAVLANVYMHQEALDNALYLYESLVKLYPDNGSYALGLGIIYQKQGKFAAAKATYQRILSFEPVYWGAYPFVQSQLKTLSSVKE